MSYKQEYYQKNKDKFREWNKRWREQNPEKAKEISHKYWVENKERLYQQQREYQKANKERFVELCNNSRRRRVEKLRAEGVTNAWAVVTKGDKPKYGNIL